MIPGGPLITEIFDPSKILLEGMKRSKVGVPLCVDGKLMNVHVNLETHCRTS